MDLDSWQIAALTLIVLFGLVAILATIIRHFAPLMREGEHGLVPDDGFREEGSE